MMKNILDDSIYNMVKYPSKFSVDLCSMLSEVFVALNLDTSTIKLWASCFDISKKAAKKIRFQSKK
jgi:hypothetical protein